MTQDNGQSQMAQRVREESEFIKQIEDFARYMAAEHITDRPNPRTMMIIAADCIDKAHGRHAMAHIMVGDDRVSRCALRSMMEDNDTFSALVHQLCEDDGGDRSVEDLDGEIGRKQKRLKRSVCVAGMVGTWSAAVVVLTAVGIGHWISTVSSLMLMALCGMFIWRDIKMLRADLEKLKQQRKRAAGRQKIMSGIERFGEFLRRMRAQLEEDAGDDDDDD